MSTTTARCARRACPTRGARTRAVLCNVCPGACVRRARAIRCLLLFAVALGCFVFCVLLFAGWLVLLALVCVLWLCVCCCCCLASVRRTTASQSLLFLPAFCSPGAGVTARAQPQGWHRGPCPEERGVEMISMRPRGPGVVRRPLQRGRLLSENRGQSGRRLAERRLWTPVRHPAPTADEPPRHRQCLPLGRSGRRRRRSGWPRPSRT